VDPPVWTWLRSRLGGRLLLADEAGFASAAAVFNAALNPRPAAVARCASPADVAACLGVAHRAGLPVAARSGGHSYPGYSSPDGGLVIDMRMLAAVAVREDGTAVVGGGARLIDVYAALAAAGRALPAGSCPSVGLAGLLLGGGIGVLARAYGLTCDRLVAATVVTGAGSRVETSAERDPELFWALRGGGGGTAGVVTEFVLHTEPAPELIVFELCFPPGSVAAVLSAWQDCAPGAPDELWSNCVISSGLPPWARVSGCFIGPPDATVPLLDGLVRAVGTRPTSRSMAAMSYLGAMRYFAGCSQRSITASRPREEGGELEHIPFRASSRMLTTPLDTATLDRVVGLVTDVPGLDLLIDALGGAVGRVPANATAFPHRAALACIQVYQGGHCDTRVRAVESGLATILGTGAYVNYLDPGQRDWGTAYFGANLPRLRAAAAAYDPDRVLDFPRNVQRT
jgi:FAD/FMN-containing dehydrogenase